MVSTGASMVSSTQLSFTLGLPRRLTSTRATTRDSRMAGP